VHGEVLFLSFSKNIQNWPLLPLPQLSSCSETLSSLTRITGLSVSILAPPVVNSQQAPRGKPFNIHSLYYITPLLKTLHFPSSLHTPLQLCPHFT
jgi:hypothetical protein